MLEKNDGSSVPELIRLTAQRNTAFAAALLLGCIVICAGWALEAIPKRNADEIASNQQMIATLRKDLTVAQQAIRNVEGDLKHTQDALAETEKALKNSEERK